MPCKEVARRRFRRGTRHARRRDGRVCATSPYASSFGPPAIRSGCGGQARLGRVGNVPDPYHPSVATAGSTAGALAIGPRLDIGAPFDERLERFAIVGQQAIGQHTGVIVGERIERRSRGNQP